MDVPGLLPGGTPSAAGLARRPVSLLMNVAVISNERGECDGYHERRGRGVAVPGS